MRHRRLRRRSVAADGAGLARLVVVPVGADEAGLLARALAAHGGASGAARWRYGGQRRNRAEEAAREKRRPGSKTVRRGPTDARPRPPPPRRRRPTRGWALGPQEARSVQAGTSHRRHVGRPGHRQRAQRRDLYRQRAQERCAAEQHAGGQGCGGRGENLAGSSVRRLPCRSRARRRCAAPAQPPVPDATRGAALCHLCARAGAARRGASLAGRRRAAGGRGDGARLRPPPRRSLARPLARGVSRRAVSPVRARARARSPLTCRAAGWTRWWSPPTAT